MSGEWLSKANPLCVCSFILAVVAVTFATMAFEEEISMTWLPASAVQGKLDNGKEQELQPTSAKH